MARLLRSLLEKADSIAPRTVLWTNLVLAGFVALSHGGALLLVRANPAPDAQLIQSIAAVSLPLASIIVLSAIVALVAKRMQSLVMGLHGCILGFAAVIAVAWGLSLLLNGFPTGNFSWGIGIFSASVCYGVFVFSRFSLPPRLRSIAPVYFSPAAALAVAVPIDIAVFIRFMQVLAKHFGG